MKRGWPIKRLGDICEIVMGQSPSGDSYNTTGVGVPLINGPVEFSEGSFGKTIRSKFTTQPTKLCKEGDLILCVRGSTTGRMNIAGFEACIGRGVAAIRASQYQPWVNHFISSKRDEIHDKGTGATFPNVSGAMIADLKLAMPPLHEQQRIVGILDETFGGIATAKANAEKNLQNAGALFESHLQSVFSQRGEGWVDRTLDQVCIVERGSSPRPIKNYFSTEPDGVNWIKIGDTEEGGKYLCSTAQKITPEGAKQSRFVREGDFILTNSMSFGRPYIMKTSGYIHDGWFVLRLNISIDTDYFYYLLSSRFVQSQFAQLASGSVVKNISGDLVKKAVLPIPPLDQQHLIVEKLLKLSAETQRLESIYQRKLAALDELKKSLLHQAFTGKL